MAERIVVLGIGNVLAGDDGVGPHAVHHFSTHYECEPGAPVEIVDGGTPGFDLSIWLYETRVLFVIDALASGDAPGTLRVFDRKAILAAPPPPRVSPHQPGLREALLTAELAYGVTPDITLYGVTGANFELGCELTAPVQAAMEESVARVVEALRALGVRVTRRSTPLDVHAWWEGTSP